MYTYVSFIHCLITKDLLELGANIKIYDPKSSIDIIINDLLNISNLSINELNQRVTFYDDHVKSVVDSNCIVILTEWDEFKQFKWDELQNKLSYEKIIFDGRFILNSIYTNKVITL